MTYSGLARWKLLSPFLFLRLRYAERRTYNLAALGIGAAATFGFALLPTKPPLLGPDGLFEDLKLFVTILFPFFVGSLVAVATYQRPTLDQFPAGGQVTLVRRGEQVRRLTRRQFVCFIFGYCSATSVLIFVSIIAAKSVSPWLSIYMHYQLVYWRIAGVALLSTVFAHMLIITFWGLYYLTDRLQERGASFENESV